MRKRALVTPSLWILFCLFAASVTNAQDSLEGAMKLHKAEMVLREYDKAGRPQTPEGKQQLIQAQAHIDEAIETSPKDAGLWFKKALFHEVYIGDASAAFAAYQKSYALDQRPQTANNLVDAALDIGEYREAILILRQFLRSAPANNKTNWAFTGKLVIAHLLNDEADQAKQQVEQLVRQDHSMFAKTLMGITLAVADGIYPTPENVQEFKEEFSAMYQIMLEQDPVLLVLGSGDWSMGYEDENERQYVRDYFLEGESPNSWNQKVSVQMLKGGNETPKQFMAGLKKFIKSTCGKTKWKAIKIKNSEAGVNQTAAHWSAKKPCEDINYQFEVNKVIQFSEGLMARIAYVSRDSNSNQDWIDRIVAFPLKQTMSGQRAEAEQ